MLVMYGKNVILSEKIVVCLDLNMQIFIRV